MKCVRADDFHLVAKGANVAGREIANSVRAWLSAELPVWQGEGILSEEQSARILGLYETPRQVAERKRSLTMFTLTGMAALMFGLSALLLVGYNWQVLSRPAKLLIVFGAILGTHGGAFYLRFRQQWRLTSEATFLLACLLYGVGIWQVAQIFHIQSHYPTGVWLWGVGVLLFALCLETPLLHLLFVALLAIWAGMEVFGFGHLGAWFLGRWPLIPNGAYSLPVLAVPGLLWAYRRNSPATVGLYAALLAWWGVLQPFAWQWEASAIYFIGAVGGLLLVIAQLHGAHSTFAIPYRLFGVLLVAGTLVPLSFYDFNREVLGWLRGGESLLGELMAGPLILVVSAAILVIATLTRRAVARSHTSLTNEVTDLLRRQWMPVAIVLLMAVLPLINAILGGAPEMSWPAAIPATLLANATMLLLAFWLVRIGLAEDRGNPFAAGVLYFLLWSVLRYFDLFADFGGMLGASLMFLIMGVAMLGVVIFWRKRKELRHA